MKSKTNSTRRLILTICVLLAGALVFAPSAFLQQGGPFTIKPSVVSGGGGSSANGPAKVAGTIGQAVLGFSSGGQFSLNAGFWQGGAACAAAAFASQPTNQTACAGTLASFSVTTTGSVSSYQWRRNGVDLTNTGNVSGALTATLTINPASASDAASYDCVIGGSCSGPSASNAVTLTVSGYLLSSASQSFPSSGGNGSVNVTTTASCGWTAVSNAPWIVITNGPGAIGSGQVTYTVSANVGGGRSGTITVAGQMFTVSQDAPTVVTLVSMVATAYQDGVSLAWRTGLEVDNLGFNLYREEGGKTVRITSQPIAGSALTVGPSIAISSGFSYVWWDVRPPNESTAYWLEDLDLNGTSTWHGPFATTQSTNMQRPATVEKTTTLASLSISEAPSIALESRAVVASDSRVSPAGQMQTLIASTSGTVKLKVKREAWYRVSARELFDSGLDVSVDPRNLQLFVDGKQQAIKITGEEDGRLDSMDSIEFYGMGLDSPFSDLRTYYLVTGNQVGLRITNVKSPARATDSGSFPHTVERRDRTIYFSALRNGELENFFGAVIAGQPVSQMITVNHLAATGEPGSVEIALQGVTNVQHVVTIQLNGSEIGELAFQGQARGVSTIQVAAALLRDGVNEVVLISRGGPSDISLVDYVRVIYQHSFTVDQDRLRLSAAGGEQITIGGFSSEAIRIFDVSDPLAVEEITGEIGKQEKNEFATSFIVPGKGSRSLIALTDENASYVTSITRDYPSSLSKPGRSADLLIIASRELMESAKPLIEMRQRDGLLVAMAEIDDIYDEYSYGQKTPRAVKDFLGAARAWKKPIRYVLMLGDASYDSKNYLGSGEFDVVPTKLIDTTFMETASDDWLTDFNGNGIADVAIGRLPARTADEAALMIGKIVTYEQTTAAGEALVVSDLNDGINFEASSEGLVSLIPGSTKVTHIKRGQQGDQATRATLIDLMNRGQRIVNYNGHGNVDMWRGVFSGNDALQLTNQKHLSMFVIMNCLNGYFQDAASDSLGEALMKSAGGAVAVWASSAMTYADGQVLMNAELYRQMFGATQPRIGDAVMNAKAVTSDSDVRRSWVLLGDPSMRLK